MAGAHYADTGAHLAARWSRQELAERDDVGIGRLVQPSAPFHKLGSKIAEMCDRTAERGQSQAKKSAQHLERRTALLCMVHHKSRLRHVRPLHHAFGGGGAVNRARSAKPRVCSICAICWTASSKPSLPKVWRSTPSNLSPISRSCHSERASFQAGNTIVSSRAAWFW